MRLACLLPLGLFLASCGSPADEEGIDGEGVGKADAARPWIGGACNADRDCAVSGARCLKGPDFPGGQCTKACTRYCPDRAGDPTTFCIADSALAGSSARCVSQCDYLRFPSGCREGYDCILRARAGDSATRQAVCARVEGEPGANPLHWTSHPGGRQALVNLAAAPFPHASRMRGFRTDSGTYYGYRGHYDDSSAYLVVPDAFVDSGALNLVVHFHGNNTSIDQVIEPQHALRQQFLDARRNAMLLVVQGPKNAADSGAGKLEESAGFRNLVTEVVGLVRGDGLIDHVRAGKVAITSHSGGYRATAFAIDVGGLRPRVSEVYLLDSFYDQYDRFFRYATQTQGRLVSLYTDYLSAAHRTFMARLTRAGVPYATSLEEGARLTFQHTDVPHGDVPLGSFRQLVETGRLEPLP
jgi:hypothetical protein